MDTLFPILIGLFFVVVFGVIVIAITGYILRWVRDNNSPIEKIPAIVVAKRTEVRGSSNRASGRTWTDYYVTFETANGARQEFGVSGSEYGLHVEGDQGTLTRQGSRYKGFSRQR